MTQAALAEASHIARPNLSAIERGDRDVTLRTLRALALALNVTPGTLADGVGPHQGSPALDREAMERIADAAVTGGRLADLREARLASHLRSVTAMSRGAARKSRARNGGRTASRAYFLLRTGRRHLAGAVT
jgi:transcriptional regulator with XRE-family HTH domain